MRFIDIRGGIQVPVSGEETTLVDKIREHSPMQRSQLDERERELARKMVSRGILNRGTTAEDQVFYVINDLEDLWRM